MNQNQNCISPKTPLPCPFPSPPFHEGLDFGGPRLKHPNGIQGTDQGKGGDGTSHGKGLGGSRRFLIPGANILADIATQKPIPHLFTQRLIRRKDTPCFQGEVTDAKPGIESMGGHQGTSWTSLQASGASSAMVCGKGVIGGKGIRGEKARQKEMTSPLGINQEGIFSNPAQSCPTGKIPFQKGCRIDDPTGAHLGPPGVTPVRQFTQSSFEKFVVILAPGITPNSAKVFWLPGS